MDCVICVIDGAIGELVDGVIGGAIVVTSRLDGVTSGVVQFMAQVEEK